MSMLRKIKFRDFPGVPAVNASQAAPVVKNPPANAREVRDMGSIGVYTHTHTLTLVVQRVHTYTHTYSGGPAANASPVAQMVKNPPAMQEIWV